MFDIHLSDTDVIALNLKNYTMQQKARIGIKTEIFDDALDLD